MPKTIPEQLTEALAQVTTLTNDLTTAKASLASVEDRCKKAEAKVSELEGSITKANEEITSLKATNAELSANIEAKATAQANEKYAALEKTFTAKVEEAANAKAIERMAKVGQPESTLPQRDTQNTGSKSLTEQCVEARAAKKK